jgi:hypothetical protein
MVSSDTVVGIVGAVILTGAMIAVFFYEAGRAPDLPGADFGEGAERFTYTFANATATVSETGQLAEGATATFDLPMPAYAAEVHLTLTWDAVTAPQVGAELRNPQFSVAIFEGETQRGQAAAGGSPREVHITFAANESRPADIIVAAENQTHAQAQVDARTASMAATHWTIVVTLVDDGYPDEVPAQLRDASSYTLAASVRHWSPRPAEAAA